MENLVSPTIIPNSSESPSVSTQPKPHGSRWSTLSLVALIIGLFIVGIIGEVLNLNLMGLMIYFIVWAIFVLIARFFPKSIHPDTDLPNLERAGQKYKNIYYLIGSSMLLSIPGFATLFTILFKALQNFSLQADPQQYMYVLPVSVLAFVLPAAFLGVIAGYFFFVYLLTLYARVGHVDRQEWDWAMYYLNNRTPYGDIDGNKLMLILAILLVPFCLLGLFLASNTYTKISNTQIIDNGYLSIQEKTYAFTDINKILHITQYKNKQTGEIEKTNPHYTVVMEDGFGWSSLNISTDSNNTEKEIIDFISQKSGVAITDGVHNVDD